MELPEELSKRIEDSQPQWLDIEHVGVSPRMNHALYHLMVWTNERHELFSRATILDGSWSVEEIFDWVIANRNTRIVTS